MEKRLIFSLYHFLGVLMLAMGQRQQGRREKSRVQKQMDSEDDYSRGLFVIGVIIFFLFVPQIIRFCVSVARDPLTPEIVKNGSELLKERTMGFLSDNKKKAKKTR